MTATIIPFRAKELPCPQEPPPSALDFYMELCATLLKRLGGNVSIIANETIDHKFTINHRVHLDPKDGHSRIEVSLENSVS